MNKKHKTTNTELEDKKDKQSFIVSNNIVDKAMCRTEVPTIFSKIRRAYRWLTRKK